MGLAVGQRGYGIHFEGTSIIIPTFNRLQVLKKCLDNIFEHTASSHEIIVVDNGSNDGTSSYLKSLAGAVRSRKLDKNRGYAGAVNVGLTMAKGTTIALLHEDTMVTHKWLDNMLRCLNSNPQIGMVGPVTDRTAKEMQEIEHRNNRQNSKRWRKTDRLPGCCLLFRRELFEQIGFFDEGFENGSCEDEDYFLRVRLLGRHLMTAGDTFVHYNGFGGVREPNERLLEKWNSMLEWMESAGIHSITPQRTTAHTAVFYPERILVRALGPTVYWIENGERHPVRGTVSVPAVRVSQVDLRRWPLGKPVEYEKPELEFRGLTESGSRLLGVVRLPDGNHYHVEGGKVRRIVNRSAMEAWNLHLKPVREISTERLMSRESGLPIIAPPVLRQML
ncbi:glycosyltransferase family 2 protein [Cohnella pontilimi]|uniref:glycosyltransferase family 2 protein n=1 Tax=Cohnella pontilimi TaxID=2564100 RepID=UPI00145C9646|nr:glycosyltransferase family 2 protein [Cohnella pontilimi]